MSRLLYNYKVRVLSVYDGDTCRVDIDLGFGVWMHNQVLRLNGINAPEIRIREDDPVKKAALKKKGYESRDYLRTMIEVPGDDVTILSLGKGKYGRWIADVYVEGPFGPIFVNDMMVHAGHAVKAKY